MRAEISVYCSPESEQQLHDIVDAFCDVMREAGFAAPNTPDLDDEVKCLVVVRPTEEGMGSEEWLESIAKEAVMVAIPSDPPPEKVEGAIVVPIGTASELSTTKKETE